MNQQRNPDLVRRVASAASCSLALMLAVAPPVFASPPVLECPTSISEKSVQLRDTPAGWQTFVSAPLYLHGAAPMSGPPEMLGELISDTERHGKKGTESTYKIDGKFPNGKWLACTYGEADQVTLARQLPDATNVCVITSRKGKFVGQNDVKIDCK